MELLVSVAGFKHDVDHMSGAIRPKDETIHTDHAKWKHHADHVNSTKYDDRLGIISDSQIEKYVDDEHTGKLVAKWDKAKKIGTVWSK